MRLEKVVLGILLPVFAAAWSRNRFHDRILEILKGPPQKGPMPPVKAMMLLCQRPGLENVHRQLVKAAGIPSAAMVSSHPDPKVWFSVLDNAVLSYDDHLVSFVLDMDCPGVMGLLQKVNDTKMFRSPYRWLLMNPPTNATLSLETCAKQAEAVLGNFGVFLDSDVIFMCRGGEDGQSGIMIEWYRYYFVEHPLMGELGSFEGGEEYSRIKWTERAIKPLAVRRANLMRLPINCGFVYRYNETLYNAMNGTRTRKDTLTKFFYPILVNVAEMLNGTFFPKWSDSWGFPRGPNGTWTGMAGMQVRGEVDLSGLPALMEHVRNTILSYVAFEAPAYASFLFRATPVTYEANLYALPFPDSLWMAAGGLMCLCFLLLYLVLSAEDVMDKDHPLSAPPIFAAMQIQPVEQEKPKPFLASESKEAGDKDVVEPLWSPDAALTDGIQAKARLHGFWSDVLLLVFGAICQQGSPVEARSIPGRIISICMLIGIMFLFTSYTATIVVLLQSTSNSIKTLHDLWKSRIEIGAEDVPYSDYLFRQLEGEDRVGIYNKIKKKNKKTRTGNNYMPLEAGMHRMRTEYFAFHSLTTSMYPVISDTWMEHEKCALRESPRYYYPQNAYLSASKFNPLMEMFRITLRKIYERGVRDREVGRTITPKPKCTSQASTFVSVAISDCYFAMVILLAGFIASLLVFGMEHFAVYRLRKAAKVAMISQ